MITCHGTLHYWTWADGTTSPPMGLPCQCGKVAIGQRQLDEGRELHQDCCVECQRPLDDHPFEDCKAG